jgi:hypothetical protein
MSKCIRDVTHEFKIAQDLGIVRFVTQMYGDADARQCTYLTIDWSQGRKFDEVGDYDYEGGYPRKGINLNVEERSVPGCLRKPQRDSIF